ncbi:uncharacterized protein H6S33_004364 [Morchella sextelata]|uniref:uncharacterized protein n=1 Tax=Morchella sextelata TaxID=1174677 RepID=UPI001D055DC7|nr:uncharacterized protein H6S33_004364 [Morchella sextelata]KAH0605907.1 hypothetical protein H6S33_004364 [Morchella sextelata]
MIASSGQVYPAFWIPYFHYHKAPKYETRHRMITWYGINKPPSWNFDQRIGRKALSSKTTGRFKLRSLRMQCSSSKMTCYEYRID